MGENGIIQILKKNIAYFSGFAVYAILGLILNLFYSQQQLFFFINRRNAAIYDASMPYITFIGDGVIFAVIIIVLAFIRVRYALVALLAWLIESAIVQVCKQLIFTDHPRPWKRWGNEFEIYLIDGFTPYSNNSFPSGHTASAFCLFTLLALFVSQKKTGFFFLLIACMVAYSRIYLAQHYFIDTYAGAWIGLFSAVAIYYYFYSPKRKFNNMQESKLDLPLQKLLK